MLHRLLGHWDFIPQNPLEIHISGVGPCAGVSTGAPIVFSLCNPGGLIGTWKRGETVKMGCASVEPLGLGHDAGPGRPHALVCPDLAIGGPTSIVESALDTLKSTVKPQFSAHKTQLCSSGSMLPACTELVPVLGNLSVTFCGTPDALNITPIVPSQLSVYTSLTLGDVVGGMVNVVVDQYWSAINEFTYGSLLGAAGRTLHNGIMRGLWRIHGRGLASRRRGIVRLVQRVIFGYGPGTQQLIEGAPGLANRAATGAGAYGLGPSNIGVLAQSAIDGDGVTHDADPQLGLGPLTGYRHDHDSGDEVFSAPFLGEGRLRQQGAASESAPAAGGTSSWSSLMWR